MRAYRGGIALLGIVLVGLGLAMIGEAALRGAPVGALVGVLFVAAGGGRLYLLRRR
ncbi:MAG TPA: hypothetical protein VFL66_10905 [Gaiellaceae bacterium]|nr:hypothetical protein [Gaiellaceae bacterium]